MRGRSRPHALTRRTIGRASKPLPWYRRDGSRRLDQDQAHLAEAYPDLMFRFDDETDLASLEGTLTLRAASCGVPTRIVVRVEFPRPYPEQEPRIYDEAGRFPHIPDRHFYPDGRCCLWLEPESRWDPKAPDGLCQWLDEAAIFFDRQLVYDAIGENAWPGAAHGHGDAGYIEYAKEQLDVDTGELRALAPTLAHLPPAGRNSRCGCGSGRKYKSCHLDGVAALERRVGMVTLRAVFRNWLQRSAHSDKRASQMD
jgi:SEC-C motif-containing protein